MTDLTTTSRAELNRMISAGNVADADRLVGATMLDVGAALQARDAAAAELKRRGPDGTDPTT